MPTPHSSVPAHVEAPATAPASFDRAKDAANDRSGFRAKRWLNAPQKESLVSSGTHFFVVGCVLDVPNDNPQVGKDRKIEFDFIVDPNALGNAARTYTLSFDDSENRRYLAEEINALIADGAPMVGPVALVKRQSKDKSRSAYYDLVSPNEGLADPTGDDLPF